MSIDFYGFLLLLHVLLFVYWLGADLAVLYSARFAADPTLPVATRLTIAQIMGFVDLFPRLSVPLIGAVGVQMAAHRGDLPISLPGIGLIWFAAIVWVGSNLYIYVNREQQDRIAPWRRFDIFWRVLVALAVCAGGIVAFLGLGMPGNAAVAAKLLIFAAAIVLSLVLRLIFRPFRPALNRIASGNGDDRDVVIMQQTLARSRPVVLGIWFLTVCAAAIGVWGFK